MFNAEYEESEQDTRDALALMADDFAVQKKRTVLIAMFFITSCVVSYPFLAGHRLNHYWYSFGKFLPLLSIAMFIALTLQLLRFQFVWHELRKAQRDLEDLLIRRKA